MERYFGVIRAAKEFSAPLTLSVRVLGYGPYVKIAETLHVRKIVPFLESKGWITLPYCAKGFAPLEENPIEYTLVAKDVGLEDHLDKNMPVKKSGGNKKEEYTPDYALKAHEENHKEVFSRGLWDLTAYQGSPRAYFDILTESLAEAVGGLYELRRTSDARLEKNIMARAKYGRKLLSIVSKAQHGKSEESLEKKIGRIHREVTNGHNRVNWATILNDTQYYGLYGACVDLITSRGENSAKSIVYETMRLLQGTPDPSPALTHLCDHLSEPTHIPLIFPFIDNDKKSYIHRIPATGDIQFQVAIYCGADMHSIKYAHHIVKRIKDQEQRIIDYAK